jgi:hypothetical protein
VGAIDGTSTHTEEIINSYNFIEKYEGGSSL